jgi:hypothetical protein
MLDDQYQMNTKKYGSSCYPLLSPHPAQYYN